jgi:hypothetical protein
MSVPGANQNVPEYNDCQKFVRSDNRSEYTDGYFAVFAHESLDVILRELDDSSILPVAEILAEEEYEVLNIETSFNCVVLYRRKGRMLAKMYPVGLSELQCGLRVDPDLLPPDLALTVVVDTIRSDRDDLTIPPVARWGHDRSRTMHTVEIKCAEDQWCSIGARSEFQPLPSFAERMLASDLDGLTEENQWIRRVKGLYDEQFLAVRAPTGRLIPSRTFAQVFPVSDLGTKTLADFSAFTTTAFIAMSDNSAIYKAKFNFDRSPDGVAVTTLSLCTGSRVECEIPDSAAIPNCLIDPSVDPGMVDSRQWWAKIVDLAGVERFRCVTRYLKEGFLPPPTTRFRWTLHDEGIWERCPDGCCEMT